MFTKQELLRIRIALGFQRRYVERLAATSANSQQIKELARLEAKVRESEDSAEEK